MSYNNAVVSVFMALDGRFGKDTEEELINSEEYKEHGYSIIDCPICKCKTMDNCWICSGCGWEHDIFIDYENDEEFSGCNGTTLGEYKNVYRILREAFDKMKNDGTEQFYIITCYSKDIPNSIPTSRTYGTFESVDACRKALNENLSNMHGTTYDYAVVESIDIESNAKEIKWFVWNDVKQGFFETDQDADWSDGWARFA